MLNLTHSSAIKSHGTPSPTAIATVPSIDSAPDSPTAALGRAVVWLCDKIGKEEREPVTQSRDALYRALRGIQPEPGESIPNVAFYVGGKFFDIQCEAEDKISIVHNDQRIVLPFMLAQLKDVADSQSVQEQRDHAATKIQAIARRYIARNATESAIAELPVLKNAAREILRDEDGEPRYLLPHGDGRRWGKLPPQSPDGPVGSFKVLEAMDEHVAVLRLREPERYLPMQKRIKKAFVQHDIRHAVQNKLISGGRVVTPYLGKDLTLLMEAREYQFDAAQFGNLARELDKLHADGIVHRDIKPENMGIRNGTVKLFDPDSFRTLDGPLDLAGSSFMQPQRMEYELCARANLIKKDQYNFFISMMHCWLGKLPDDGAYSGDEIDMFIARHIPPSSPTEALKKFLQDPLTNDLSGLRLYF